MPKASPKKARPKPPSTEPVVAIEVRGARTHNLRGVDCSIPHGRVTVVTGPSGAGKSSLAFDTVYAEGQRRFVESMSTYARQFLDRMERPPVEVVDNILPAVALEAKNSVRNARSTVGTITETHDVLRLLFTHLGEVQCPQGHGAARAYTVDEIADELIAGVVGQRFVVLATVARPKKQATEALRELIRQGFARRYDDHQGAVERMTPTARWLRAWQPLALALGRYRAEARSRARLTESLEEALRLGGGRLQVVGEDGQRRHYGRGLLCTTCGESFRRPTPPLFSFNSPLGACPGCQGFGRVIGIDPERVIPNPRLSLRQRPIAPWNSPAYEDLYDELLAAARQRRIPLTKAWQDLSDEQRQWVWSGRGPFTNLDAFFRWLERRTYRVHVRVLLARYRAYDLCPDCAGTRLKPEALVVRLAGSRLPDLTALSIENLRRWLDERGWSAAERARGGHLLAELSERVEVLSRVGLEYLTLDRQARTLSGGETQRIHLAAALGSGLTSTLYALDEPTIGLHPRDSERLLGLLRDLAGRGNTVLVVEHDRTLIEGADHLIDLGPEAGEGGGELLFQGPPAAILGCADSLTGRYLARRPANEARRHRERFRRESQDYKGVRRLRIRGARENNLRGFDVDLPLGALVAVTGVSGSGKSTLVENVLYGTYQRSRGVVDVEPGECDGLEGLQVLSDIVLVDQRPLGRSSRSNPVTYTKAYDEIRKVMASEAPAGITAGHFSFNTDKGRCAECLGTGMTEIDMQFMAPVAMACESCEGRRFQPRILEVRFRGLDIAQILELTVTEALALFDDRKALVRRLSSLVAVGLGYLRLGQSTATLSGGEAQRLKLASFLEAPRARAGRGAKGRSPRRLFLFDEPTTGLHMADIDLLYQTLRRLVKQGDGVLVVEHSPDLIARADWLIELGPGGGVHGGELLYSGPPESFLDRVDSPTADELRRFLRWRRRR
ncbi:MAG: excinuclease ABC subunit UvrA [Acidobacteriota bacterium]